MAEWMMRLAAKLKGILEVWKSGPQFIYPNRRNYYIVLPLMRLFTLSLLLLTAACASLFGPPSVTHWAAYYDDALPAEAFAEMDLVVFDRDHHPPLGALPPTTLRFAYLSIGELGPHHPVERQVLRALHAIVSHNKSWKSEVIDPRSKAWRSMLVEAAHEAKAAGFQGLMLDTVESPLAWAKTHLSAEEEADVRRASIELIREIHAAEPELLLMLNRGFDLLPELAADLHFILAESILAETNVSAGQFHLFPADTYAQVAAQLRSAMALAPHLQVLTLDYWKQDDVHGLAHLYATQRAHGFAPYVTTPDLRHFTPEPLPERAP